MIQQLFFNHCQVLEGKLPVTEGIQTMLCQHIIGMMRYHHGHLLCTDPIPTVMSTVVCMALQSTSINIVGICCAANIDLASYCSTSGLQPVYYIYLLYLYPSFLSQETQRTEWIVSTIVLLSITLSSQLCDIVYTLPALQLTWLQSSIVLTIHSVPNTTFGTIHFDL